MLLPWQEVARRDEGDYYIFRLMTAERISPRTEQRRRFVVLNAPDWVNVVAITPQQEILFVRQYRHGIEQITTEIPAGMAEKAGESPLQAAQRELLEETGYAGDSWSHLGTVEPNPAFMDNRCHTFLARDVRQIQQPAPDGGEDIEFDLVPLAQLDEMVGAGQITHSLTIAALFHFERWRRSQNDGHLRSP